jgi:hypothetical protein
VAAGTPRSIERSAEPVAAWRAWRLRRDGEGGKLRLQPAFRGSSWEPLQPVRAACARRRRHEAPKRRCTCGLYGFNDGSEVGIGGTRLAVVGQVSMWGRVVEHDLGYRAEFAYPARMRLVCSVCLTMGERPATPVVVAEEGGFALPLCEDHARSHRGHMELRSSTDIEAELLSTYAVDVLPEDSLPPPPAEEQPLGSRWWRGASGKGIIALLMGSLLLRVLLLWAAVSSGMLGSEGLGRDGAPGPAIGVAEVADSAAGENCPRRWVTRPPDGLAGSCPEVPSGSPRDADEQRIRRVHAPHAQAPPQPHPPPLDEPAASDRPAANTDS